MLYISYALINLTLKKSKGCIKIYHANNNQKKVVVAMIISDRVDFKAKSITQIKMIL